MNVDDLIKKIQSDKADLQEAVTSDEGMEKLRQVAREYQGEYRLVWSDETLEEIKNSPKKPSHMTGEQVFDDLTGGIRQQQVIGVGAQSGHGKTAFGLWLLKQYEYLNPVLIPLEQSSAELIEQRLENNQFIPRYLSPKRHSVFVEPEWVEMRIVESIAKYNSKMIMLDHMGYIQPSKQYQREPDHIRIEKKLQEIGFLAEKWDTTIVILIQLQQMKESEAPQLRDLKGSSAIRQECDKVLFLWRNNTMQGKTPMYDNKVLLSMQKNRFTGKNKNAGAEFQFKTGHYLFNADTQEWCENLEMKAREELTADDAF